jgi:hypothetical protein
MYQTNLTDYPTILLYKEPEIGQLISLTRYDTTGYPASCLVQVKDFQSTNNILYLEHVPIEYGKVVKSGG